MDNRINRVTDFLKLLLLILTLTVLPLTGCSSDTKEIPKKEQSWENTEDKKEEIKEDKTEDDSKSSDNKSQNNKELTNPPEYKGETYVNINGGNASFTGEELDLKNGSWDKFSSRDSLNRCGVANAMVGRDIMPTEKRGPIGMVKPSGWKLAKYDSVDGKYLYNRCHLIGFQLTGQNANEDNLVTGTRWLNVEGMLPFENQIADYVKSTGKHVRYQVTPVFVGDELVCRGVHMKGYSVEDKGAGVNFNVFVFNEQPNIKINHMDGSSVDGNGVDGEVKRYNQDKTSPSYQKKEETSSSGNAQAVPEDKPIKGNINSKGEKIYHVPGGRYYNKTIPEETFATEEDALLAGYRRSKN